MMIFLWEKSGIEVEAAQKILYIFAVNATLSKKKREGDLNYFNFKSWKLSFHLSKKFSFTRFASNI